MIVLRPLVRLIGVIWMLVLALAGLAIALYCFDGIVSLGSTRPDRLLRLAGARRHVGHFLNLLAAPGSTAGLALLCSLAAIAVGVLLIIGVVGPRRPRVAVLERDSSGGTVAARLRPLRDMAQALAEQADGATSVRRPKVALSRRRNGGRLRITASRASTRDPGDVSRAIEHDLQPLTEPFRLRPRIRIVAGQPGKRVQ
jgi:hypothetical protein